ncbi:MAG: caspase family protein, partial [Desulfobacterales bacterium]|nr:caspase family protein [Desulfobacterales bacterium]
MKIIFIFFSMFLSLICCVTPYSLAQESPYTKEVLDMFNLAKDHYYGILIGIDRYSDPKILPFNTSASKDILALDAILKEQYGFKNKILLNEQATKQGILNLLYDFSKKMEEDANILIYFSGNGELERLYNYGWWLTVDSKSDDVLTYLDQIDIRKAI